MSVTNDNKINKHMARVFILVLEVEREEDIYLDIIYFDISIYLMCDKVYDKIFLC